MCGSSEALKFKGNKEWNRKWCPKSSGSWWLIVLRIWFCIWSTKSGFIDWRFWLVWSIVGQEWSGTGPFQTAAETSGCPVMNYLCVGSGGNGASNKPWRNRCWTERNWGSWKGHNAATAPRQGAVTCYWGHNEMLFCRLEKESSSCVGRESELSLNNLMASFIRRCCCSQMLDWNIHRCRNR